jgi:hypothetical protein
VHRRPPALLLRRLCLLEVGRHGVVRYRQPLVHLEVLRRLRVLPYRQALLDRAGVRSLRFPLASQLQRQPNVGKRRRLRLRVSRPRLRQPGRSCTCIRSIRLRSGKC